MADAKVIHGLLYNLQNRPKSSSGKVIIPQTKHESTSSPDIGLLWHSIAIIENIESNTANAQGSEEQNGVYKMCYGFSDTKK